MINKVIIDGSALKIKGGPRKYLLNLLKYLPHEKISLFMPKDFELPFNFNGEKIPFSTNRFFAEEFILPFKANKYKLFFGPKSKLPYFLKTKSLIMLHDTIPIKYPKTEILAAQLYWKYHLKHSALNAFHIITGSHTAKKDIINTFNIPGNKVSVIYHSAEKLQFNSKEETTILKKYALSPQQYLLYTGTIQPRKGIDIAIEAFNILQKKGWKGQFCITGRYGWKTKLKENPNIVFTDFVSEKELNILYKNAAAFVYMSKEEGFGLPPIEAGSYGIPLVLSDIAIFRELHKDYAFLCNRDPTAIALYLEKAIKRGYNKKQEMYYTEQFSPQKTVSQTWQIMEKILNE